jgi:type II secretion system protein N
MMELARFRLPRPTLSLEWLGALGGRSTILYLGYTSVLFLICLVVTFPHDLLIRRALMSANQGSVAVEFTSAGFGGTRGYELSGLRISPRNAADQTPYLECTRFFVRPAFGELLRGNPYALVISADLYGGTAHADVSFKGGGLAGNVEWHDLSLGRYRPLTAVLEDGQLAGRLSGQFSFEARAPNFAAGQASGELTLDGASLSDAKISGFTVPDAKLTQTKTKFKIAGGRIEIQDFLASGDVGIQGSGQIVLRDPLSESALNLRATFLPTPATPPALKGALLLIPRQPGAKPDAPVTITGPLGRPKMH